MDSESKQLLENTLKLAEENNKLLHKIRGVQKRETLWGVLKIILLIGFVLGSFYYLEPYLTKIVNVYNSVTGTPQRSDSSSVQDFFKKF